MKKDQFVNETSQYYANKNYKEIQNVIKDQDLQVSYNRSEDVIPQTRGTIRGMSVSNHFYHLAKSTKGAFQKEWVTLLSGNFSYDSSTMQVTSVSGPRITLDSANFGAAFSPYMDGILTSNSKSGAGATFSANYTMKATLGASIGDFPIGFNFNFGNHTDKWTASSMQP
ncbi:hypothetical protein ACQKL5_11730 [Peribacillus sp. NPDC097675]|uniref:hypothetical protein n=1 Tax=Peribacillus sp. NPDC097675 TaxID=3390618 RepID=UPI003D0224FA